jgi:hypothetical protein
MPAEAHDAARPGWARSSNVTEWPRRASSRDAARPITPPPMTIASANSVRLEHDLMG